MYCYQPSPFLFHPCLLITLAWSLLINFLFSGTYRLVSRFTKLAKGDVDVNLALLPINLFSQILLLPLYLYLFTNSSSQIEINAFFDVFLYWVLYPFLFAQSLRMFCSKISKGLLEKGCKYAEWGMFITLAIVVFTIFNANIQSLISNLSILPKTLVVVTAFFLTTYFLGQLISKVGFTQVEKASLIMTFSQKYTVNASH